MKHPLVAVALLAIAACVPQQQPPEPPPRIPPPPSAYVRPAPEPNLGPVVQGTRDIALPPTRCPPGYKWRKQHRAVGPGGTSHVVPARCIPRK